MTAPSHRLLDAALVAALCLSSSRAATDFDCIVYGATPSGIMSALSCNAEGLSTLLLHPLQHIGGMVTGGLGQTDSGNSAVIGGAARNYFVAVGKAYGHTNGEPQFTFEPHVAEAVFLDLLSKNSTVQLVTSTTVVSVAKTGTTITSISTLPSAMVEHPSLVDTPLATIFNTYRSSATTYTGKVFLDATYEGDLLAQAGISYAVGREAPSQYNESVNGRLFVPNHIGGHQFGVPVNYTYPNGTLLPMIYTGDPGQPGDADSKIQAYNFRMCLTNNASNRVPMPMPSAYDPTYWELFRRYIVAANITSIHQLMNISPMPFSKTDINNNGAISTDYIGGGWAWPEATPAQRTAIWNEHYQYTAGFFYFLGHDDAVPVSMQTEMLAYGFTKDEFQDNSAQPGWPWQLYVREGRRMMSDFVFTQNDRVTNVTKPDSIGLFSYNIDNHNAQRFPQGEYVRNEGDEEVYGNLGPGQMPYRMIVPKVSEATNVLVPVAVSATHAGFGTIRLEPQWMIVGQSAGVAAAQAVKTRKNVQDIDIATLQARLTALGQILKWTGGENTEEGQ